MSLTVTWQDTPLKDARDEVAAEIESATGLTVVTNYKSGQLTAGNVMVEGQGWTTWSGCEVAYRLRITVVYASQTGDGLAAVEELTRRVFVALVMAGATIEDVEPPGVITGTEREYQAQQFTTNYPVDLGPVVVA